MILIQHPETGEQCLVENTEGYDGWSVVADDAPMPPDDDCEWCCNAKGWKRNRARRERRQRCDAMRNPERLADIIEAMEARIAALESQLAKETPE